MTKKPMNYKKNRQLIFGRHRFSLMEAKIVSYIMAEINHNRVKDLNCFTININDIYEQLNGKERTLTTKERREIINASKKLMTRIIEIEDDTMIFASGWVQSVKHIKGTNEIEMGINKDLQEIYKSVSNYLESDIENIAQLGSPYLIRLYEILKYEHKQNNMKGKIKRTQLTIVVDELKEMFKTPKSYRWIEIKERIIDKAQKEFKQKTDIQFSYEISRKLGKKVEEIEVTISNNETVEPHLRSFKEFVKYLRKYPNTPLEIEEDFTVAVSTKGLLYDFYDRQQRTFNKKESEQYYMELLEKAKEGQQIWKMD